MAELDPQAIVRRLHDEPVQELTAALLFLEAAIADLRGQGVAVDDDGMLERSLAAMRRATASTRAIMRDLADAADP